MNALLAPLAGFAPLAAFAGLWLVVALLVPLAAAGLWPVLARHLRARSPETRARIAGLAAAAPLLVPTGVVLLCALPGWLGALTGAGDHCTGHGAHPHFCPVHATLAMTAPLAAALLAFGAVFALHASRALAACIALTREGRWLRHRLERSLSPNVHVLGNEVPIALTRGLFAPEIWIAQRLLDALEPADRAVVLAHEQAHAARRDPARFLAADLASRLHLPRTRRAILGTLRLAAEQACDARAGEQVGDRLQVATTLLRVERLMQRRPITDAHAAALHGASLPARIEALVAAPFPAPESQGSRLRLAWPWLAAAGALVLARPIHHLAEHALEALLRSMVGLSLLS